MYIHIITHLFILGIILAVKMPLGLLSGCTSPNLVLPREYFSRSLCARGAGKAGKSRTKDEGFNGKNICKWRFYIATF